MMPFAQKMSEDSVVVVGHQVHFRVAVEEGATIVRLGQVILGPRPA